MIGFSHPIAYCRLAMVNGLRKLRCVALDGNLITFLVKALKKKSKRSGFGQTANSWFTAARDGLERDEVDGRPEAAKAQRT